MKALKAFIVVLLVYAVAFLFVSTCVYGICWAFGYKFTWKMAFGVWIAVELARYAFESDNK